MVRTVLIAAIATLGLDGCYSPQFADCADTCGTSKICPEGLTCKEGFCRVEGAAGTCEIEGSGGVDGMTQTDAPPMACPPVPMMQGCTPVGPPPAMPYCHVTCSAKTATEAHAFRVGSWHSVVIADATELAAVMASMNGQQAWIGLRQATGQSMPVVGWTWVNNAPLAFAEWATMQPDDMDTMENGMEQCAAMAASKWSDEPCAMSKPHVIEPF